MKFSKGQMRALIEVTSERERQNEFVEDEDLQNEPDWIANDPNQ